MHSGGWTQPWLRASKTYPGMWSCQHGNPWLTEKLNNIEQNFEQLPFFVTKQMTTYKSVAFYGPCGQTATSPYYLHLNWVEILLTIKKDDSGDDRVKVHFKKSLADCKDSWSPFSTLSSLGKHAMQLNMCSSYTFVSSFLSLPINLYQKRLPSSACLFRSRFSCYKRGWLPGKRAQDCRLSIANLCCSALSRPVAVQEPRAETLQIWQNARLNKAGFGNENKSIPHCYTDLYQLSQAESHWPMGWGGGDQ